MLNRLQTLLTVAVVGLACAVSSATATSAPRRGDNGLGVVLSQDNPFIYNMGIVAHGDVLRDPKGREFTAIDFAPVGGRMLFPEGILLCGNQAGPLMEHQMKVVVLTYERQAHTMTQGIGCHELHGVNEVKQ